ncbi:MAG: hypothetical protein E6Q88_12455 [Lysobacteraceae bacterium]|nr:MAG: hypothetical protein E6Q88_12455 [Xanthomonadaceae bacterium]
MEIGGAGILIPVVVFVLMLYVIKGVYGLTEHGSKHRKEFLAMWDSVRAQDDLWLEVSVRHHFGAYLPATVIRLALTQPDKGQSLIELCQLWSLLSYDRDAQTVKWLHKRHETLSMRRWVQYGLLAGYFMLAFAALGYGSAAIKYGPHSMHGWFFAFVAAAAAAWACIALVREDTIKMAAAVGDEWVRRINENNQTARSSRTA